MAVPTGAQAEDFLQLSHSAARGGLPRTFLYEKVFYLYQLDEVDQERIKNFMLRDFPRFRKPRTSYSVPANDDWLQSYSDVVASALRDAFLVAVTSTISRKGNYCAVAITIGAAQAQDSPVTVDIDEVIRARRNVRGRGSTGIFALPAGFFVRHD